MPSTYWNRIHGREEKEVLKDAEGVQMVRVAAKNMAWLLKVLEQNKVEPPTAEQKVMTNFVR